MRPRPRVRGHRDGAVAAVPACALDSPVCDVLRTGEPVYLETLDDWEHYAELRSRITGIFQAMVVVPLRVRRRRHRRARALQHGRAAVHGRPTARSSPRSPTRPRTRSSARGCTRSARTWRARCRPGCCRSGSPTCPGLEVAVRYHSIADGGAVGGDFYDCFDISPGRWLVAVGDVAGKGTAAAVLTGLARHTLRAIALRDERPEDMLRFLNEALRRQSVEIGVLHGRLRDARAARRRRVRRAPGLRRPSVPAARARGRRASRRSSCAARCSASRPSRCSSRRRSRSRPATRSCSTPTA